MIRELSNHEINALQYELLLKDIMATAEKLPPFPDVVWKVMSMIRKTAPVKEIEAVIKYDQAITARVLSLSQSAYFNRKRAIKSLHDAILVLGSQRLVQVVMAACTAPYFQNEISGHRLHQRELWQHSVSTAIMGEKLAQRLKHPKVLTAYTAGLMHDIGRTVLDLYAKIYLQSSLNKIKEEGMSLVEAERKTLGIDHQELGEKVSRRWKFPAEVIAAVGHHHLPQKAPEYKDIVAIVYASNRMVNAMNVDESKRDTLDAEQDRVFKALKVTTPLVTELQGELSDAMKTMGQFLSNE